MITVALTRAGERFGLAWTNRDGSVSYDDSAGPFIKHYATPPHVITDGIYHLLQVRDGGRSLTVADGEDFLRALPWALGIVSGSTKAYVVADSEPVVS